MADIIRIDGQRLADAIAKRNLKITVASREMGFGSNYLTDCVARNTIPKYAMVLVHKLFNITEDEIKPIETKSKPIETTKTDNVEDKLDTVLVALNHLNHGIIKLTEAVLQNTESTIQSYNTMNDIKESVNKIGNVEMQSLDYQLSIKKYLDAMTPKTETKTKKEGMAW